MESKTADSFDLETLNLARLDIDEKSISEPDIRRTINEDGHIRKCSNTVLHAEAIHQLALKCDEKLKIALKTAEENAVLKIQISEMKTRLSRLQRESSTNKTKDHLSWTDLLSKSSKLTRKDRVLLVQSLAGQLGMVVHHSRSSSK